MTDKYLIWRLAQLIQEQQGVLASASAIGVDKALLYSVSGCDHTLLGGSVIHASSGVRPTSIQPSDGLSNKSES